MLILLIYASMLDNLSLQFYLDYKEKLGGWGERELSIYELFIEKHRIWDWIPKIDWKTNIQTKQKQSKGKPDVATQEPVVQDYWWWRQEDL